MANPPEPPGEPPGYEPAESEEYVVGILYENAPRRKPRPRIILKEKARPEWQKGRLNGVGGKIEPGESPAEAMAREWKEEVNSPCELEWDLFCILNDHQGGALVHFFRSQIPEDVNLMEFKTAEKDEPLVTVNINNIWSGDVVWNIPWVVHLGLDPNVTVAKVSCTP